MERLAPALKRYQETLRQPRITEWLTPGEGSVAVVRSARMQEALRGLRGEPERPRAPEAKKARRKRRGKAFGHLRAGVEASIELDSD